jgi:hypothetical protein
VGFPGPILDTAFDDLERLGALGVRERVVVPA